MAPVIEAIQRLRVELPPSCVAFCPWRREVLVVGTYYLHPSGDNEKDGGDGGGEEGQRRSGSLVLYEVVREGVWEGSERIQHIATTKTDYAVLDVQWTPHHKTSGPLVAVAGSVGQIVVYRLGTEDERKPHLDLVAQFRVADPSLLVLSLAWHPQVSDTLGFTLSDSTVSICSTQGQQWSAEAKLDVKTVHQHSLEAWTLAFAGADGNDVFSGGDDIALQYSKQLDDGEHSLMWTDRKLHEAGVTAILPLTPELVATGSYDDHIRLIACPVSGRRQVLADENLGGGVWRLKLLTMNGLAVEGGNVFGSGGGESELKSLTLLASCMHAGTRILALRRCHPHNENSSSSGWHFSILARFEEHKSMNYGSDVQPLAGDSMKNDGDGARTVVSTSFYDKLMCLWKVDLNVL